MVSLKKAPKKLIAVLLSLLMIITAIPAGLYSTVFAAANDCLAIEVNSVKVYFYGVDTLEVNDNKVTYTGGDETINAICVDGSDEVDTTDVVTEIRSIEFTNEWLTNQDGWIAVICDSSIDLPSSEPNVDVDKSAPVITEDDIAGIPTEWTEDNVTVTVNATDDGTGVVAYSLNKEVWQTENTFEITNNGDYIFYAKDAVGNVSEGIAISVDKIDKEAPIISSVAIDPDTWTNKAVSLIVTADDEGYGLAEKAYKMDDGEWQESNKFTVDDSEEHTFYVRDKFENEEHTSSINAKADKHDVVKPTIDGIEVKWNSLVRTPDDFTSKYIDYDFYVDATDDKSGIAYYSIDGENFQESNKFTMKGAGNYTFYVKDNAGNVQECEYSLKGDDTKPVIDEISYSNENPTNEPITVTVTAHDIASGLNKKAYKLDNEEWQESNEFIISDCKEHIITVRDAADAENEITQSFVCDWFCDEIPTVDNVEFSTYEWTNEDIIATVIATGTENTAGTKFSVVAFKMDGSNWQENNDFVISDCNEHSFWVKDEANNISEAVCKTADNYDNVAPTLTDGQAVSFEQKNDGWFANLLNKLTFGRFFNERLVITVDAQDAATDTSNASGVVSAEFEFIGLDGEIHEFSANEIGSENSKYGNTITFEVKEGELPRDFKGAANVVLTDAAKNSNIIKVDTYNSDMGNIPDDSEYCFMIENTAPKIDSVIPSETPVEKKYKEDFSVNYKFSDTAGDNNSGIAMVKLEVNGTEVLFKDYQSSETYEEEISVKTDAEHKTVNGIEINNWNNGELTYSLSVVDNAGNVSEPNEVTYYFDQTAPEITGFEFSNADDGYYKDENSFDKIYEAVTAIDYGFYFKNTVKVTVSAEDKQNAIEATSTGVKSITVYLKDINNNKLYTVKADGKEITEISTLDEIATVETNDKLSFVVPKDFKGQIYAYATDNVDNSAKSCRYITDNDVNDDGFVSPDGSIIETTDKHTKTSSIEFTSIPKAQGTQNNTSNYSYSGEAQKDKTMDFDTTKKVPLYNRDITFGVKVTDSYSGIREVSYTIIEGSEITVKTVQIDNDGKFVDGKDEGWTINDSVKDINLVTEMTNNIAVSGNYNDMVLLIELTDRAGNKSYDYYVFGIDKTAPSIEVEYDNNSGDSQSGTGTYFKANRTATITVSERNFNKENVNFIIKNAEGDTPSVKFVKDVKGTGNGDDTKHIFEVTYSNDGVYSFNMNYTDRAANKNTAIDYKNSLSPTQFVIDKTNPTISVSYDNNEAQNEKFFKAHRTATVKIVEHNFDVNRVVITQTSALSGNAISNPSVSWVNSGDTHTGTIKYNADGDYTFDITMTDKAGNKEDSVNYGSSVAAKDFTIDTTYSDIVKVDGIADKGVLGLENGNINADAKINITINDVNLDNYNIKLTRSRVLVTGESDDEFDAAQENVIDNPETQCAEDNNDVTAEFVPNASGTGNVTVTISIPKKNDKGVKNDGLYTLTIEANDKAGNAYDTNANIITFSVNRFGSVFTFSNDLYNLITKNDGYTQSVAGMKLSVFEYNATSINSEQVEVIANNDSNILNSNTDYTVAKDTKQTDTSWSKYTYNVKPENFANDGVYTLRISSKDAASITSQTVDYDVCSATFRVDKTPADIISVNYSTEVNKIAGHNGGSAKAENLTVNFTVEDLIRLEKVEVYVNDMDNPIKTYVYGKDFDDANTFDGGSFEIARSSDEQTFKIVATDKAGNVIDTSEGDSNGKSFEPGYVFFDHITVTTNQLVIWAKSPVFWGIIGGIAVIALGIIIFVVVKKRKKDDDEENANPQA